MDEIDELWPSLESCSQSQISLLIKKYSKSDYSSSIVRKKINNFTKKS